MHCITVWGLQQEHDSHLIISKVFKGNLKFRGKAVLQDLCASLKMQSDLAAFKNTTHNPKNNHLQF